MNRTSLITLAIAVPLCALAILIQKNQNKELAQTLAERQRMIPVTSGGADSDSFISVSRSNRSSRPVEPVLERLLQLGVTDADIKRVRQSMPEILSALEGLEGMDLLALAEKLPEANLRTFIIRLAAESAPSAVLRNKELLEALGEKERIALQAKVTPQLVVESLPKIEPPVIQGACLRCHGEGASKKGRCDRTYSIVGAIALNDAWTSAFLLMETDVRTGLEALKEMKRMDTTKLTKLNPPFADLARSGDSALDDRQIPEMLDAMEDPRYAELRPELLAITLNHALNKGGVEDMARLAESTKMTSGELLGYMNSVIGDGQGRRRTDGLDILFNEPEATMNWVAGVQDPEVREKMMPRMLVNWVKQDSNSALTWLGAQQPSPQRDQMIANFVRNAPNLYPSDMAGWSLAIQNEAERASTIDQVIGKWRKEDPAAADQWLQKNGLSN